MEPEQVKGDTKTNLGWWSDRLESRKPSWLVGARCTASSPVAFVTLLQTTDAGSITSPAITMDGARATVTWSEHGAGRGLTIDRVLSGAIVRGPFSWPERTVSTP